jgi:hypothetical protein
MYVFSAHCYFINSGVAKLLTKYFLKIGELQSSKPKKSNLTTKSKKIVKSTANPITTSRKSSITTTTSANSVSISPKLFTHKRQISSFASPMKAMIDSIDSPKPILPPDRETHASAIRFVLFFFLHFSDLTLQCFHVQKEGI